MHLYSLLLFDFFNEYIDKARKEKDVSRIFLNPRFQPGRLKFLRVIKRIISVERREKWRECLTNPWPLLLLLLSPPFSRDAKKTRLSLLHEEKPRGEATLSRNFVKTEEPPLEKLAVSKQIGATSTWRVAGMAAVGSWNENRALVCVSGVEWNGGDWGVLVYFVPVATRGKKLLEFLTSWGIPLHPLCTN